jgi:hypothetical protein
VRESWGFAVAARRARPSDSGSAWSKSRNRQIEENQVENAREGRRPPSSPCCPVDPRRAAFDPPLLEDVDG